MQEVRKTDPGCLLVLALALLAALLTAGGLMTAGKPKPATARAKEPSPAPLAREPMRDMAKAERARAVRIVVVRRKIRAASAVVLSGVAAARPPAPPPRPVAVVVSASPARTPVEARPNNPNPRPPPTAPRPSPPRAKRAAAQQPVVVVASDGIGTTIRANIASGDFLLLEDGTLWEIDDSEAYSWAEGDEVLVVGDKIVNVDSGGKTTGSRVGHAKAYLRSVSDDGDVIVLSDGSAWETYDPSASLWLSPADILVLHDGRLINIDDEEVIDVVRLR